MTQMLSKNPVSRLFKMSKIKQHPYFQTFSWEALISMSMEVPQVPKITKDDLSKSIPYINHMKTVKDWQPSKDANLPVVDEKTLKEYEKWFSEF
jgi:hypothetical protein